MSPVLKLIGIKLLIPFLISLDILIFRICNIFRISNVTSITPVIDNLCLLSFFPSSVC